METLLFVQIFFEPKTCLTYMLQIKNKILRRIYTFCVSKQIHILSHLHFTFFPESETFSLTLEYFVKVCKSLLYEGFQVAFFTCI